RRHTKIIGQRIEPDVGDEFIVERNRNAPVQTRGRAGDTQILQALVFQETEDFIATVGWRHELGMALDIFDQPLLMRLELEIIIFLLELDDIAPAWIKISVGQT